jgi:hypothetical protein
MFADLVYIFSTATSGAEEIHKQIWANNGDVLSIAYTGTGALKSHLMRTGKVTWTGLIDDSIKSVKRTYQNYVLDNDKQEIIDWFLGNSNSSSEEAEEEQDWLVAQLKARQQVGYFCYRQYRLFNFRSSWKQKMSRYSLERGMLQEKHQGKNSTLGWVTLDKLLRIQTFMLLDFKRLWNLTPRLSGMQVWIKSCSDRKKLTIDR